MKKSIIIASIVIVLALIGGGVFWYGKQGEEESQQVLNTEENLNKEAESEGVKENELEAEVVSVSSAENINIAKEVDISDWLTYRNEEYGYELKYPEEWLIMQDANQIGKPLIINEQNNDKDLCKISLWVVPDKIGVGLNLTKIDDQSDNIVISGIDFDSHFYINEDGLTFISLEKKINNKWYILRYYLNQDNKCKYETKDIVSTFILK